MNKVYKLNLGSGSVKRLGYVNIDLSPESDLVWDLTKGLPYPDDSINEIRSDHFFEHLEIDKVISLFGECHRVLKPGGKLDFTVPHIDPYIKAYIKKDKKFLKNKISDIPPKYKRILDTPFDIMMWLLYRNGEHKTFFDKESVVHKLKLVGFKQVKTRKFDSKKDINKRYSSVYVVATK